MLRFLLSSLFALAMVTNQLMASDSIRWQEDLTTARQQAMEYKVPVLIHFYGDHCLPCKTLEENVFTRPEVASAIQKYFIPVRINATQNRRSAAEFGVHSWPTDVFLSPDGKTLSQGVCSQNAQAYLQNLQAVAVMNRDRNLLLANKTTPNSVGTAAPATNRYLAASAQPEPPYGRTVSPNMQQTAPGRDQAPNPYSNSASGAAPYADQSMASALTHAQPSSLPSPSFEGQSVQGQAASGLAHSGPLAPGSGITIGPAITPTNTQFKDANIPPSAQWQSLASKPNSQSIPPLKAQSLTPDALAADKQVPTVAAQAEVAEPTKLPSPQFAGRNSIRSKPIANAVVDNPHFPDSGVAPEMETPNVPKRVSARLASAPIVKAAAPPTSSQSATAPSEPAFGGFCPVSLLTSGQWLEGKSQYAIRHRGRIYYLSSPESAKKFLADPDTFSPVISGYDPLVLLREGKLIEGSVYTGLKDPSNNRILLFSSEENKRLFKENCEQLSAELDALLNPNPALTAAQPANTLIR